MAGRDRGADGSGRGTRRPLSHRLAWFAGLWVASVALLGAVASVIRAWLGVGS